MAVGFLFYFSNTWTRNAWLAIVIRRPLDGLTPRSRRMVELYREHLSPVSWSLRLLCLTTPLGIFLILEDFNAYVLETYGSIMSFFGLGFPAAAGVLTFLMAMDSLWKETRTNRRLISEKSR